MTALKFRTAVLAARHGNGSGVRDLLNRHLFGESGINRPNRTVRRSWGDVGCWMADEDKGLALRTGRSGVADGSAADFAFRTSKCLRLCSMTSTSAISAMVPVVAPNIQHDRAECEDY